MQNPNVQLMIHGSEVGLSTPSISYPGVSIKKVHKADSKNHLFIDLFNAPTTKPGTFPIAFKKEGKKATVNYSLLARQKML
jgi:hypothetical protein